MRTFWKVAAAGAALSTSAVVLDAPTAEAATVSVSGTQITVTSTTDEDIRFRCQGGTVRVNNAATSPSLACSALTKVVVSSNNATSQSVYGNDLSVPAFSALPSITATLGAGDDFLSETARTDTISMGSGVDELEIRLPTTPNTLLDLGADLDVISLRTIDASDTVTATSAGSSLTLGVTSSGGATSITVGNAEDLVVETLDGDDTITTSGITAASTIDHVTLSGGDGDDELNPGAMDSTLFGNAGTNDLNGGSGDDTIFTGSETDDISVGGGTNRILDASSLRSGGRTLAASGSTNWYLGAYPGDAVVRVRSGRIVTALSRPGRQDLTDAVDTIDITLNMNTEPQSAAVVDVIASDKAVGVLGKNGPRELVDIHVPAGSWSVASLGGITIIDPTNAGYANVAVTDATFNVHGAFADTNQHYAHRLIRDLMFRFPTPAERDALRTQLNNGTKTPASAVAGLMDTDEYRGLDVDRVFVKYLRRTSDPSGRAYWINALENGRALWRFRAQLFGSNEYFTKAGGTNAAYVTKAYSDVLGRNPDPSGQAYWTNKLDAGAERGMVALQFINSAEARRRLVDEQYLRFVERLPTVQERDPWVAKLPTPTGELELIAALASGTSYYEFD